MAATGVFQTCVECVKRDELFGSEVQVSKWENVSALVVGKNVFVPGTSVVTAREFTGLELNNMHHAPPVPANAPPCGSGRSDGPINAGIQEKHRCSQSKPVTGGDKGCRYIENDGFGESRLCRSIRGHQELESQCYRCCNLHVTVAGTGIIRIDRAACVQPYGFTCEMSWPIFKTAPITDVVLVGCTRDAIAI